MLLATTKGQSRASTRKNVYSPWIPALRNNFTLGVSVTDESNEDLKQIFPLRYCNHYSWQGKEQLFLNFSFWISFDQLVIRTKMPAITCPWFKDIRF